MRAATHPFGVLCLVATMACSTPSGEGVDGGPAFEDGGAARDVPDARVGGDASVDGADAGADDGGLGDGGPPPCPAPGASGTVHLYGTDMEGPPPFIESIVGAPTGLWAVGRGFVDEAVSPGVTRRVANRVLLLRTDEDGALTAARELMLAATGEPRAARTRDGVVVALTADSGLWLLSIHEGTSVAWVRRVVGPSSGGVLYGTPLVTADDEGIFVVAPLVSGIPIESVPSSGVHLARFDHAGNVAWERRLFAPSEIVDDRYRPGRLVPTELALGGEGLLLATRTTSFGNRWYTGLLGGGEQPVQAPWLLFFDRNGGLIWQRFVDPRVGIFVTVHVADHTPEGWLLGGATVTFGSQPLVMMLTDDGTLRSATVIDDVSGGAIEDWLDPAGEPSALVVSNSGALPSRITPTFRSREILRLSGVSGRFAAADDGMWYAGRPPSCSDFPWTGPDVPWGDDSPFCGTTARLFAVVHTRQSGDRGCSDALWDAAPTGAVTTVPTLPLAIETSVVPTVWSRSEIDSPELPPMSALALTHEMFCAARRAEDPAGHGRPSCLGLE